MASWKPPDGVHHLQVLAAAMVQSVLLKAEAVAAGAVRRAGRVYPWVKYGEFKYGLIWINDLMTMY